MLVVLAVAVVLLLVLLVLSARDTRRVRRELNDRHIARILDAALRKEDGPP